MPDVTQANSYILGQHTQTNEATVGTVADYSIPVYGGRPTPTYEVGQIAVTDANAIAGDTYKKPSSWILDGVTTFGHDAVLGTQLKGMWTTDTPSGSAPSRVHAYTGIGTAPVWQSYYGRWPNAGAKMHTFGRGHCTYLSFESTSDGGPLVVGLGAMGEVVTDESSTVTTAATLTDGYFALQAASSYIRGIPNTPNSSPATPLTNVKNLKIEVSRSASMEPTADAATVTNINPGLISYAVEMDWLWADWTVFNMNYFGSSGGTTLSGVQVNGALEVLWKHSVSATSTFKLYIPAMTFAAEMPEPNPDGSSLTMHVTGRVQKPTAGDHVVPTLTNNVTPAY